MNIVVSALQHDDFAEAIAERPPTMLELFERALAGEIPGWDVEQREFMRMREGLAGLRGSDLASQARFVVLPLHEWDDRPPEARVTPERFDGQWMHVQKTGNAAILVPDDGNMARFNIALYVPQPLSETVTVLIPARYRPQDLAVEAEESLCQEGYEVRGNRRRGICVNNGCQGNCKLTVRIEKSATTYHCPCS
jgi:hypothetical protein